MPGVKPVLRRVAGAVLLVGAVLIGARLLESTSRAPVPLEIHYLLGDPPPISALEVQVSPEAGDAVVARFETRIISPDVKQITRLPAGRHVMDITMIWPSGARRSVRRTIEAARDVVIRLDLRREAREP
jgi:hypothetical protein